jgi:hypothetical protein
MSTSPDLWQLTPFVKAQLEAHSIAIKRVLAWQIAQAMKEQHISKRKMAELRPGKQQRATEYHPTSSWDRGSPSRDRA